MPLSNCRVQLAVHRRTELAEHVLAAAVEELVALAGRHRVERHLELVGHGPVDRDRLAGPWFGGGRPRAGPRCGSDRPSRRASSPASPARRRRRPECLLLAHERGEAAGRVQLQQQVDRRGGRARRHDREADSKQPLSFESDYFDDGDMSIRSHRDFLRIWAGQAVSNVGDGVHRIAVLWWARQATGSDTGRGARGAGHHAADDRSPRRSPAGSSTACRGGG